MPRQYEYITIDNYYFCLQQNPVVLAWVLFFRRDDLITVRPWLKKKNMPPWRRICSRYYWNIFKQNLITLLVFVQCRLNLRELDTAHLPVYGHFGIAVHKGYKIFNLRTRVVTKIFGPDIDKSSILSEIEQLKKVAQISFAPSLKSWDIDERWYQEDYIRSNIADAHSSTDSSTFLEVFYRETVPCMHSLILFQRPVAIDLAGYLKKLISILEVSGLSKDDSNLVEAKMIRDFVDSTVRQLNAEGTVLVQMVFTHGDFCPANSLRTKDGIIFIDWESSMCRSMFFDFYSYFFYRPVCLKISNDKVYSEINEALPVVMSILDFKRFDTSENIITLENIYRRLYYIELICKLAERKMTDNRLNIMDFILRYVEAFSSYENLLNSDPMKVGNSNCSDMKICQSRYETI